MQLHHRKQIAYFMSFNPHPSRGTGATEAPLVRDAFNLVSILTRPEGRVQHTQIGGASNGMRVSILTRPEGRVQHHGNHPIK